MSGRLVCAYLMRQVVAMVVVMGASTSELSAYRAAPHCSREEIIAVCENCNSNQVLMGGRGKGVPVNPVTGRAG